MLKNYVQQVFELRYEPYIDMLDRRGFLTDLLSKKLKMPEWIVGNDRIDITSKDKKERCFISYKELGYALKNPGSHSHFQDRTTKFLNIMSDSGSHFQLNSIKRLGVRSNYLIGYEGKFEELLKIFKKSYLNYSDEKFSLFKGTFIDAGVLLNFKTSDGYFNTNCGPMKKEQYSQFFDGIIIEDLPDTALFLDIDYFKNDFNDANWKNIIDLIQKYSQRSNEIHDAISAVMFK